MIIKGGARSNGRFYAAHLMRADTNERVEVKEFRGLSADSVRGAFSEMALMAEGTRATNPFYVVSMNPCEDERLSAEQWRLAVDRLEDELGLAGQPRLIVEHLKEDRTHIHVAWSRIDADTMTAIPADFNYRTHEQAARGIERELGLRPVESVLVKNRGTERPDRRPKDWEGFRAADTGIDPEAMKREITALWHEADSGVAFRAAIEDAGYILAKGDRRDFCVVDQAGDDHSLARRISGVKAAGIRARMADLDRDALPSVAEARRLARDAVDSGGGTVSQAEPDAAAPSVESQVEAELARQFGPAPKLSPEAEAELAARYGDWTPAPQATPADWQAAEPGEGADQREEFTAWERFAARLRSHWEQFVEFVQDEWSAEAADTEPEPRSWVQKVGRTLTEGARHFAGMLGAGPYAGDEPGEPPGGPDRDPSRPDAKVDASEPDDAPPQSASPQVKRAEAAWPEVRPQGGAPTAGNGSEALWWAFEEDPEEGEADNADDVGKTREPDAPEPDGSADWDL